MPQIIARDVRAEISDLDAGAQLSGTARSLQIPREDLLRHEVELLDTLEELLVEQRFGHLGARRLLDDEVEQLVAVDAFRFTLEVQNESMT